MKTLTLASVLMLLGGVAAAQDVPPAPPDDPSLQQQPVDPYNGGEETWSDVGDDGSNYEEGNEPQAYSQFQGTLAPYGSWSYDAGYGYVWTPSAAVVGVGFTPYGTGGHWVWTEYGWTWVSDWDWGWAPFHYGRWYVGVHGWCWAPGTHWGPGWVAWRSGGGYVGWAPLAPHTWVRDHHQYAWHFTTANQMGARNITYVPSHQARMVIPKTTYVRNDRSFASGGWHYNSGPTWHGAPARMAEVAPHAMPRFASAPVRNYAAPERGYVQPARTYAPPAPARTYAPPAQPGYPGPARTYAPPAQPGYPAPARTYAPPAQPGYPGPARTYAPPAQPVRVVAPPSHGEAAPVRVHPAPQPRYAAPMHYSAPASRAPSFHAPSFSHAASHGGAVHGAVHSHGHR
jgi:hypothetical protein